LQYILLARNRIRVRLRIVSYDSPGAVDEALNVDRELKAADTLAAESGLPNYDLLAELGQVSFGDVRIIRFTTATLTPLTTLRATSQR
jgi:hypothetical protein